MKITTNNRPRALKCWLDLPESERYDFDYIGIPEDAPDSMPDVAYEQRFFMLYGSWYDAYEFERVEPGGELEGLGWAGVQTQSYFDAIVLRWCNKAGEPWADDAVVVGHATW